MHIRKRHPLVFIGKDGFPDARIPGEKETDSRISEFPDALNPLDSEKTLYLLYIKERDSFFALERSQNHALYVLGFLRVLGLLRIMF